MFLKLCINVIVNLQFTLANKRTLCQNIFFFICDMIHVIPFPSVLNILLFLLHPCANLLANKPMYDCDCEME